MSEDIELKIERILNSKPKKDLIKRLLVEKMSEGWSLSAVCMEANISRNELFTMIRADEELKKLYSVMLEYTRFWWERTARVEMLNNDSNAKLIKEMMVIMGNISVNQRTFTIGLATEDTLDGKVKLVQKALDDQEINMDEAEQLLNIIKESEEIVTRGDLLDDIQAMISKIKD